MAQAMRYRFNIGALSDQQGRMGMAEVVGAYRAEAGVGGGQVYGAAGIFGVLS